jgi:mRNA-degrading endonuclease RelE of RelBE toxin-antitoxin system
MYALVISNSAKKQIKKLPPRYQKSAIESLKDLKEDPFLGKALARELKGTFSFQFGSYWIIYKINKQEKRVEILAVRHRKYAYY